MKIFKIYCNDFQGYDYYDSHVIVANNVQEVIDLAKKESADEGEENWDNSSIINKVGIYTGEKKEPFILLSSFNAG